jgi:hypothetical protein
MRQGQSTLAEDLTLKLVATVFDVDIRFNPITSVGARNFRENGMKSVSRITTILAVPMLVASCGGSAPPSCDDPVAKGLLEKLLIEQVMNAYATLYSPYADPITYRELKQAVAQGAEFLGATLRRVETDTRRVRVSISAIRAKARDEGIQKAECSADVSVTGGMEDRRLSITYSAQYIDGGKQIYVELSQ